MNAHILKHISKMTRIYLFKLKTDYFKKHFLLWVLLLITGYTVNAQTDLALGDIAITGYQADTPDKVSIVFLKDITANTSFFITDNGWLSAGGFRSGEGIKSVSINQALSCGTEVWIDLSTQAFQAPNEVLDVNNVVVGAHATVSGTLSLSNQGDQFFIYQGPAPTATDESNFITGIQMNGGWDANASGSTSSAQPSVFMDGINSISFNPERDNAAVNCNNLSTLTGTPAELSEAIYSSTWDVSNSSGLNIPSGCAYSCVLCMPPVITCPIDNLNLPLGCNPIVPDPDTSLVTYTEGCGAVLKTHEGDAASEVDCIRTITRTYSVRDENDSIDICTQLFTFTIDTIGPVFSSTPADVTVACDAIPTAPTITATDNCTDIANAPDIMVVLDEVSMLDDCDGGTITRTWAVTDSCGNASMHTQTINVMPPAPPTITCPADEVVTCFEDIIVDPSLATASSNCVAIASVYIKNPIISGIPGCDGTVYTYIYVAVDECGRMAECEQQFLLQNNAPNVLIPGDETVTCFEDIEVSVNDVTVDADCAGEVTINVLPPVLNGNENCPNTTYTYTYRVKDACNRIVEEARVFTIGQNEDPTILAPADFVSECAVSVNGSNAIVTTACGNGLDYEVSVSDPQIIGNPVCPNTIYRYTYTVTDACGRTAFDTQDITIDNEGPVLNCSGACEIFTCNDGDYNDLIQAWIASFTATASCGGNVTVSNDYNGISGLCVSTSTTPVVFTAIDECGRITTCTEFIFIVDSEAPIIYEEPSEMLVPCNGLTQTIFDDWIATQGGAEAIDGCYGNDITWSTNPTNPTLDCAAGPQAIFVEFIAMDGCGNASSTTGVFNTKVQPGTVNISGQVNREDSEAIENVQIGIEGTSNGIPEMNYTSNAGSYGFPEMDYEDNMTLVPEKNNDYLNGLSTYDILLLHKHILFIETLDSPYKQIAADINQSGTISTFDLVLLRRLILHIDSTFSQNGSWRFIDANFVFPNPQNPFESEFPEVYTLDGLDEQIIDFVGIKIGDLNLSALTNGLMADSDDRSGLENLTFKVADMDLKAGEQYRIDFSAQNFQQIEGFQFTIDFDPTALEIIEVLNADLIHFSDNNYGLNKLSDGALTFSWNHENLVNLNADDIVFSLLVSAQTDSNIQEILSINSKYTKAEAYRDGALMNVNLEFTNENPVPNFSKFNLFQNHPNPFKDATVIGFNLPEKETVNLMIYDISGRLVYSKSGWYEKGYNQIDVNYNDLPASGVFYYHLNTAKNADAKKMILLE